MKDKLQALIKEQKALTAKFEELLNSNAEESPTVDLKKVFIKGHPTRGAEVIKMLEDLGGVNQFYCKGTDDRFSYYIRKDGRIDWFALNLHNYTELHLPEEVSEVDPPAEEVEQLNLINSSNVIVGDIYTVLTNNHRYIFIHNGFISNGSFKPLCVIRFDESMEYLSIEGTLDARYVARESSNDEKEYILKAIEHNGKHFDKENMRLLDVEEWSCKKGLAIIVRNDTTNWRVDIFHSYDAVDEIYPFFCSMCKNDEGRPYEYAIPYNDQTKHLIGSSDSPNKLYKFVSE